MSSKVKTVKLIKTRKQRGIVMFNEETAGNGYITRRVITQANLDAVDRNNFRAELPKGSVTGLLLGFLISILIAS